MTKRALRCLKCGNAVDRSESHCACGQRVRPESTGTAAMFGGAFAIVAVLGISVLMIFIAPAGKSSDCRDDGPHQGLTCSQEYPDPNVGSDQPTHAPAEVSTVGRIILWALMIVLGLPVAYLILAVLALATTRDESEREVERKRREEARRRHEDQPRHSYLREFKKWRAKRRRHQELVKYLDEYQRTHPIENPNWSRTGRGPDGRWH